MKKIQQNLKKMKLFKKIKKLLTTKSSQTNFSKWDFTKNTQNHPVTLN